MLNSALRNPGLIDKSARPAASRARLMAFVFDAESEASLSSCLSHLPFPDATIKRGGIAPRSNTLLLKDRPKPSSST